MNKRQEIIALATDLIRYKTVEGNMEEFSRCLHYIREYFADSTRLHIKDFSFNGVPAMLIANQPNTRSFDILMNGHIDVVPAPDIDFEPTQKNGKLYGRGASDMKASVAAMMATMKHTAPTANASIGLMIVCDEEVGGFNGTGALVQQGYRGRVVLIPDDMGNLELTTKEKGILQLDVTFSGQAAHSCEPWKGNSAIDGFVAFASELRALFPRPTKEAWQTTCNIGTVNGGEARNQLAPQVTATLDIRFTEDTTSGALLTDITALAAKHAATVKKILEGAAVNTPLNHPMVEQFAAIASQVIGRPVGNAVDHGASDARFFAEVDCPVVLFKPPSEDMHGTNEAVEINGLVQFYQIITRFCKAI